MEQTKCFYLPEYEVVALADLKQRGVKMSPFVAQCIEWGLQQVEVYVAKNINKKYPGMFDPVNYLGSLIDENPSENYRAWHPESSWGMTGAAKPDEE